MKRNRDGQPGYYPGFSTLAQQPYWDEATRKTILERVSRSRKLRFFTPAEVPLIEAIFEHILPQSDRSEQYRIPILPTVDDRLYNNRLDGYRYEDMPPDQKAYRLGMKAIDEIAKLKDGRGFLDLTPLEQDKLLKTLHDGKPEGADEIWKRMPVHRFWMLLVQDAAEAYYSHPYAWDEIGFGGPAYPRAYMRLERGEPEPWEVNEQRYAWLAPEDSVSDVSEWIGGHDQHLATPGQGGTH
ncbi:MAG: gluconate 2-dehydrogenase subunit 3 family protein [Acidobacteriaceae bacterium]